MNCTVTYQFGELQAVALLAAIKLLTPEQVATLTENTRSNLSIAYHSLNGALARSLYQANNAQEAQ